MSIEDDRQISRFIPDRLPEFVRVDHPTLVAFLEAYYEWLGLQRNSGVVLSPMAMHDIPDVDTSLDQFIENFKNQYLFNFPQSLAVSKDTGMPVDTKRLLKNIKQFYLAKGTEKSYEFLFRILYDTNVEFYYPKTDILRLSSGRWIQNNYLRVSDSLGDDIFRAEGNLIVQKNSSGEILATARVISVNVFHMGNFGVAEMLISGRNGTFQAGELGIEFQDGDETFREGNVFSVVSSVTIEDGGANYQVGERVKFVSTGNDGGMMGMGMVAEVDSTGSIRKINIDEFGINYNNPPTIEIETGIGSGFVGTASVGSLCQSFGYYADNDGRLSTNKVLQDNHYYQNWSYVLKSEVVVDRYRDIVRRLVHPAGTAMFGSVQIKRCNSADLNNSISLINFQTPYIGNYAPYTLQTFDDLSVWFRELKDGLSPSGYSPTGPTGHDALITAIGDGFAVNGNPISNNISFVPAATGNFLSTPNDPNGDPFWIVYPHANKQVERKYHYARIWKDQADDFINWPEWNVNREGLSASDKTNWYNDLVSSLTGDNAAYGSRGALLYYDEGSEFRKITMRSFFDIPAGEAFDCREEAVIEVLLPQFVVVSPTEGQAVTSNDPNRPLTVRISVENPENIPYYDITQVRMYIDNVALLTSSINSTELSVVGIIDGQRTLKLEMLDSQGRLVSGTQKIMTFGYQFVG